MRFTTIKIILSCSFLLQSCAVVNKAFIENRQKPGPDASNPGVIGISSPTGNLADVKPSMESNCSDWGGLRESSIQSIKPRGGLLFTDYWIYNCNGLNSPQPKTPAIQPTQIYPNSKVDIETAKQKCTELGFKSGTEGFGKCVLQLSK